MKLERV